MAKVRGPTPKSAPKVKAFTPKGGWLVDKSRGFGALHPDVQARTAALSPGKMSVQEMAHIDFYQQKYPGLRQFLNDPAVKAEYDSLDGAGKIGLVEKWVLENQAGAAPGAAPAAGKAAAPVAAADKEMLDAVQQAFPRLSKKQITRWAAGQDRDSLVATFEGLPKPEAKDAPASVTTPAKIESNVPADPAKRVPSGEAQDLADVPMVAGIGTGAVSVGPRRTGVTGPTDIVSTGPGALVGSTISGDGIPGLAQLAPLPERVVKTPSLRDMVRDILAPPADAAAEGAAAAKKNKKKPVDPVDKFLEDANAGPNRSQVDLPEFAGPDAGDGSGVFYSSPGNYSPATMGSRAVDPVDPPPTNDTPPTPPKSTAKRPWSNDPDSPFYNTEKPWFSYAGEYAGAAGRHLRSSWPGYGAAAAIGLPFYGPPLIRMLRGQNQQNQQQGGDIMGYYPPEDQSNAPAFNEAEWRRVTSPDMGQTPR